MPFVTVHADEQPTFLAAKTEVLTGKAGEVKLDGLLVFGLFNHERTVEFVVQRVAHWMRSNALWHGLEVAVKDLSKIAKAIKAVHFRVHQRHTDRRESPECFLEFANPALFF